MSASPRLPVALPLLLGAALLLQGCDTLDHASSSASSVVNQQPTSPPTAEQLTDRGMEALRKGDWDAARAAFEPAANQGDTRAQVALGSMYFAGLGVVRDFADASHWFTPAAAKGDAEAEYNLGLMTDLGGTGIVQDHAAAAAWYEKAAAQGHVGAAYQLGLLYENGTGVPQDVARAASWFRQAAAGGNGPAMTALGSMYDQGRGVTQNEAVAMSW